MARSLWRIYLLARGKLDVGGLGGEWCGVGERGGREAWVGTATEGVEELEVLRR